ncbi:MAG: glycosyltransferase family 2 protein [Pseudomonadota bacterium]
MSGSLSVILPAKNEAASIVSLVERIRARHPDAEILVVNDGSTDETATLAEAAGARVFSHPYALGNGAAIKSGARRAQGEILVFMDADGQHNPKDIERLLAPLDRGYDMVVGARIKGCQVSRSRAVANCLYNALASWMVNHTISDLTSGFRAVRARHFRRFLYLLPNGFSYPTTITMAFFRAGLPIAYVPIEAGQRVGSSHIRMLRDGTRFFLIIMKVGALFSPMRLFLPVSATLFAVGCWHYAINYITQARFTNMSALLFMSALLSFLIGLVSEQISALHYKASDQE